ncbi:hypothetical protein Aduo_000514 [Ancylostoma duodenale]
MLHLRQYTKIVTFLLVFNLVIMLAYISHRSKIDTLRYKPGKQMRSHPRHGPRTWRLPPVAPVLTSTKHAKREGDLSSSTGAPEQDIGLSASTRASERNTDAGISMKNPVQKIDLGSSTKISEEKTNPSSSEKASGKETYLSTSGKIPDQMADLSASTKKLVLKTDSDTSAKVPEQRTDDFAILDTCPLKVIDPLSPELLQFHTPDFNPKENCTIYKPLTKLKNGTVVVLDENKKCIARCLFHETESKFDRGRFILLPSDNIFECDVVETNCEDQSYMHLQIHESDVREEDSKPLPNVYLLILDSVSNFMAKRSLPKTLAFLKEEMDAVEMEFLNKVGDNSRPNGFPMVFGKSIVKVSRVNRPAELPDWNIDEICYKYMDEYPYYLEEYRKKGYKTMIAQDFSMGILSYQVPFDLNYWDKRFHDKLAGNTCGESHLYMLDYYEKFMNSYPGVPKIAQAWPTELGHEDVGNLYHADSHFLEFLRRNQKNLDNSFFFFAGDHGPRTNGMEKVRLGRYENRNPFLVVVLPKYLRKTAVQEQLREKSLQLMTHFDLHATFMDILHFQPKSNFTDTSHRDMLPCSKGSSLLREWKGPRNCNSLPIPWDYCLCQYEKEDVKDKALEKKLGTFIAGKLNEFLENEGFASKCIKQHYDETLDAQKMQLGENTLYSMLVKLKPSGGKFSAEVLETPSGLKLVSHFTRWGWYGKQGDCVWDPPRPLCHCSTTEEAEEVRS